MTINSAIPLDVIFQQCYDPANLDPGKNPAACLSCFQGIYEASGYSLSPDELAATIFESWGALMDAAIFLNAMLLFKKADGSQAFDNHDIELLMAKYYIKEIKLEFSYPAAVTSVARGYQIVAMGEAGVDGLLTKIVASSDVTDQGFGRTWGSEWKVMVHRDKQSVAEAQYVLNNPSHINPQRLRQVERVFDPPALLLKTDKVTLGAFRWYVAHEVTIVNTSFELYITPIKSLTKLNPPESITFRYDESTGFTIGWNAVKGSYGYNIRLVDQYTKSVIAAAFTAAVNTTFARIPLSSFTAGNGPYIAMVSAIGAVQKLDSDYGQSAQNVQHLPKVPSLTVFTDGTKLGFLATWGNVANNDGYEIQVIEQATNRVVTGTDTGPDSSSIAIPIRKITGYTHINLFRARVRAKKDGNIPAEWTWGDIPQQPVLVKMDWKTKGDGLLTFESTTGLYFLSWKAGGNFSRDKMEDQLQPGGTYAGFRYASTDQFNFFLAAAGSSARYPTGTNAEPADNTNRLMAFLGAENFATFSPPYFFTRAYLGSGDLCVEISGGIKTQPTTAIIHFGPRTQNSFPCDHVLVCANPPVL
jgi:hypothetical protein